MITRKWSKTIMKRKSGESYSFNYRLCALDELKVQTLQEKGILAFKAVGSPCYQVSRVRTFLKGFNPTVMGSSIQVDGVVWILFWNKAIHADRRVSKELLQEAHNIGAVVENDAVPGPLSDYPHGRERALPVNLIREMVKGVLEGKKEDRDE